MIEAFDLILTTAGLLVGIVIGICGVGGGAIMTPFLIYYGIPPSVAVGTDLLYASITKAGGVYSHHRMGTVVWPVVARLLGGSIPGSLIALYMLNSVTWFNSDKLITSLLAITLLMTAAMLLLPQRKTDSATTLQLSNNSKTLTIILGFVIGLLVTITSVGAGALGAAFLILLYPLLPMSRIVGTDIAHALPLTFMAAMGHLQMGNIDTQLLLMLLAGSLPGVYIGSRFSRVICESIMRKIMASLLSLIATGLLLQH